MPLTWLINNIMTKGEVPNCWKAARVLPLHKGKSKSQIQNYRPVSILSSPSKIMEEVVMQQLVKHLNRHEILPRQQFGFRAGHSTVHAAGAAFHDWLSARQRKLACGTLLFDLSAAFDTLDVELLVQKLDGELR